MKRSDPCSSFAAVTHQIRGGVVVNRDVIRTGET